MTIHPWRRLRDLDHVTLLWHDGGPMGLTNFINQTISLRRGMTYEQRRCTVLHEVLHIERGPVLTTLAGREELRVRKETARLILPDVRELARALVWARTPEEAAWELAVDLGVLRDRLRHLHPAERGFVRRALEEG